MKVRLFTSMLILFCLPPCTGQEEADLEAVVISDAGTIRFEFLPDKAPKHVQQFVKLARQGYYDGSAFFRVIPNAVVQGGDPLLKNPKTPKRLWGTGGLNLIEAEYSDVTHDRGVVSTVRIPDKPNSDGSQFFLCLSPQPALDGKFSAFGRVTEGMEVADKISLTPAGPNGITEKPIRITRITIEKKKAAPFATATAEQMSKIVTLTTTLGTLKLQMRPEWAPEHVRNFLTLTQTGWYDGTEFHRVIKSFVAQGGMGHTRSTGASHRGDRWVHTLKGEFRPDLKHTRGMVSMARTNDPDSASTSFFLVLGDAPHLDGQYTIFAEIIDGKEVLDAFEREEIEGEKPKRRIELITAAID